MTLQERIKYIQNKLGLTQKDFAQGLQIPPGSVSDWYNNGVTPRADKLELLVDIYKVNPDFLLRGHGKPFIGKQRLWTKKNEKRLNLKYKHLLFLINHNGKSDLVKGFYEIFDIKNWKEALDQKLGKTIFGNLNTTASNLNLSPNILLVEVYSKLFTDIIRCLSLKIPLKAKHLYVLSEVCEYDSEDFMQMIPKNPFSKLSKNELYSYLEYSTRLKYIIYGIKGFAKDSKTSNTAWQGIKLAFQQLDDVFRYQEIPNLCEHDDHQFFYWTKCPLCEENHLKPLRSFDEEYPDV